MSCQWRQLAAVRGFVQSEENDGERGIVAKALQQRLQRVNVFGRRGNIGSDVAAEAGEDLAVMIAAAARMNLHHQAVVQAHTRHFCQHLCAEELLLLRVSLACDDTIEERGGGAAVEVSRACRGMPVIGCGATQFLKALAGMAESEQVAWPAGAILAVHLAQPLDILAETIEFGVDDGIGTKSRQDARFPS